MSHVACETRVLRVRMAVYADLLPPAIACMSDILLQRYLISMSIVCCISENTFGVLCLFSCFETQVYFLPHDAVMACCLA